MTAAIDRYAAALARDGWCVVGRAVPPELIAALDAELDAGFAVMPPCRGAFYSERTKRFGALLTRAPEVVSLAMHPLILELLEQLLLPWCDRIAHNLTQAIEIHPGALLQLPIATSTFGVAQKAARIFRQRDVAADHLHYRELPAAHPASQRSRD